MKCPMCGSELAQGTMFCSSCGAIVSNQPEQPAAPQPPVVAPQPVAPQQPEAAKPPKPQKEKKKPKNLALKIIAAVLALVILAVSALFLVDAIMFKKEVEAEEIITDFPVLKQKTEFLVYNEESFPATNYRITVERIIGGGILKSEAFRQTKVIIDDESTEPVYNIDFEEDGEYYITLEDISDEDDCTIDNATPTDSDMIYATATDSDVNYATATDSDEPEDDDEDPLKVIIKAKVDNSDGSAVDKVDVNSKKGDGPIEITTAPNEIVDKDEPQKPSATLKFANGDTISTGMYHTVGVKSDGTVVAVGYNDDGQCNVSGWTDIVAVSAGDEHTVGLKSDGTVVATGNNYNGQCDVSDWTDIVAVSAGDWHTVGLKSDGTVVAVGLNSEGQCNVSDWTDIIEISGGKWHTVGLKSDGTVVATGFNREGQCEVSSWTDIVAVAAGIEHTVGVTSDGTVVVVGKDSYYGRCNVSGWTDIVAVEAEYWHTVGLKSDGTVVAVGDNDDGQCNVSGWTDIVAIEASYNCTMGLKSDGTVVTAGWNRYGKCNVSGWTDIKLPDGNKPIGGTTDEPENQDSTADWVTAYRDFLLNYEVDEYSGEYTVFSLCYIDSDDIPEIVIGVDPSYAAHAHGASVYTYYNGSVNFVCNGGQYGEIQYLEKGNMICGAYSGMGSIHIQTYEIQNGTGVCIWDGYNDSANVVEEEDATYESNGSVVTLEEYVADSEQYYPYESLSTSGDYCSSLTEGNIYYHLSN